MSEEVKVNIDTVEDRVNERIQPIIELLLAKQYKKARDESLNFNPADLSEIIEEILEGAHSRIAVSFFRLLKKDLAADVFQELESDKQKMIIDAITDKEMNVLVEEMDFDDMIDLLEELPASVVDKVIDNAPKSQRKMINTFLNYPEDSAGSLMTPDYISLKKDWTVAKALKHIKSIGMDKETVYTCYVKDTKRQLLGYVSLRTLVVSSGSKKIASIMSPEQPLFVNVYEDKEVVSEIFKKYGFMAVPVCDSENRIVGIITVDDILEVIEEEATEDIEKMAAIKPSEKPYFQNSVFSLSFNRIIWLLVLMITATVTGGIITSFEDSLSAVPALVSFIPMLMDTGGNAGAQSSTMIIRGMAIGDIESSDIIKVLWKEIRVSLLCGLGLSLINFIRVIIMNGNIGLTITVTLSLFATVIIAKTVGCLLPIGAKKIKLDPAIMASPLITTIVDSLSLIIYFSFAKIILKL